MEIVEADEDKEVEEGKRPSSRLQSIIIIISEKMIEKGYNLYSRLMVC